MRHSGAGGGAVTHHVVLTVVCSGSVELLPLLLPLDEAGGRKGFGDEREWEGGGICNK